MSDSLRVSTQYEDSLDQKQRRPATSEAFPADRHAAQNPVQSPARGSIVLPLVWNSAEVLEYVRKIVHKAIGKETGDDENIFGEHRDNSLQSMYISNSFIRAIRQTGNGAAERISQNFVLMNPTITGLAKQLQVIAQAPTPCPKLQEMEELVTEFSMYFPKHRQKHSLQISSGEVILLTGSTGSLGCQLLADLVSSPEVFHVFALNRRSEDGYKSLRRRQFEAFSERGLDVGILNSPKVTLVEGDTATKDLDIDSVLFNLIRENITLIIHNAWKVNFNADLAAFKGNIRGVRSLIDLALGSPRRNPPRIIFTSSVSVFTNWNTDNGRPLEARVDDPELSLGSGYGESKLVAERILENAGRSTSLRPIIVRIGQLTGTSNGAWSCSNWPPLFVYSGQIVGVLPERGDCIAWLPLETAAKAIFEFRHSKSQYLHLAHPNPALWSSVFDVFASQLNVPLVKWTEWVARLEESVGGAKVVRVIDVFRGFCRPTSHEHREGPGLPLLDLQQALKASPSLSNPRLPQVGREDAERWIRYWRSVGFLSNYAAKL